MSIINFRLRSDIKIGCGLLRDINEHISDFETLRPLIICDNNIVGSDYFNIIKPELDKILSNGVFYQLELNGEPSYELLSKIISEVNIYDIDSVISIGGGSTMDVGKGIALLSTNKTNPKKLKGFPTGLNNPLKHITIPSVIGSGAEASYNAVFVDEAEGKKLGINSINNFPSLVLVDPELSMSAPTSSVISSALDSLVHCVDSFGSKKSSSLSRMFSIEGFRNAWKFLTSGKINNSDARIELALASINGIYGLMNSGDGPTNGFAYYFGVKDKIPHGYAGGMFLKDVMRWNYDNGFHNYEKLIENTPTADMNMFFNQYSQILHEYSVPTLKDLGHNQDECIGLIDEISSALGGSFAGNPIRFDKYSAEWVLNQQFN